MGRFGNQMEQMIGGLSFAKMLNRTLILPPLREDLSTFTTFTDWFQVDPILEFHRVIKGEDFMQHYGESYWPAGRRNGYCRDYVVDNNRCRMKYGLPHSAFWDYFNVDFDGVISFDLIDEVDLSLESEVKLLRKQWIERFPSSEHPVLAMYNVPGSFPSLPGNKFIQKYIKWNSSLLAEADKVKQMLFGGEKYLGIHLRVGEDWDRVCQTAVGVSSMYFASPQCKSSNHGRIFQGMCYPSVQEILDLTKEAIMTFDLRHLYIASDDNPYKEDFKETLHALNVTVHHYNPTSPHLDLIMLGEADYFIGNCISTFTSFIKRERDARGRLSTFWGYPV
ncbi:GDP-fucose protein O-fucosyltransferase 1-like isoform X2 [Apostichopus japonicus]